MRLFAISTGLALALAACGASDPYSDQKDALAEKLTDTCQISIREILSDGNPSVQEIIGPEHIKNFDPDISRQDGPYLSAHITFNSAGSDRIFSHTSTRVGKKMAVFCGEQEISRSTINNVVVTGYFFSIPVFRGST